MMVVVVDVHAINGVARLLLVGGHLVRVAAYEVALLLLFTNIGVRIGPRITIGPACLFIGVTRNSRRVGAR